MNDATPSPDPRIAEAAAALRARGFEGRFDCAMVLGTGLGKLADDLEEAVALPYAEIPHFPRPSVSGHPGQLIAGRMERKRVLLLQGRAHYYETGDAAAIRLQGVVLPGLGEVPVQAVQALPYLMTVVLLAGFIGRAVPPRAAGVPYVKER